MHTVWRLATTCSVLAVVVQVSATLLGVGPAPASADTAHTFSFRTESDRVLTEWALARFQRAGLQLPLMTVAFHDDKRPCFQHFGYYRSGDTPRVDLCGSLWDRSITAAKKTILHELAHAWAGATLIEPTRERFLRFRGLDTWGDDPTPWEDDQTPWEEQGSEQAAEIIAWALMDKELVMVTMNNADPVTLARAYQLLTSTPPPAWGRTAVTVSQTASPDHQRLVDWAAGRFREAGLARPKVDIE